MSSTVPDTVIVTALTITFLLTLATTTLSVITTIHLTKNSAHQETPPVESR
ncbi:hypothetical protein ACFYNO_05335 [Kitasatospora sp. NPDC006697]|uniref:hypothetical protein n=1 Tax=Kitasatospora sp. NPDC006697 TaxID=3364020 RepID=UPI0036A05F74